MAQSVLKYQEEQTVIPKDACNHVSHSTYFSRTWTPVPLRSGLCLPSPGIRVSCLLTVAEVLLPVSQFYLCGQTLAPGA